MPQYELALYPTPATPLRALWSRSIRHSSTADRRLPRVCDGILRRRRVLPERGGPVEPTAFVYTHGCTCATFAATAHSIRQNASALRFWLTLLGALMNEPAQRQMAESDVRFYIAEARCLAHRCLAGRSGLCGCTCCCLLAAIRMIACRARHRASHAACCYVGLLCARHHCSQSVHEGLT